jgi:hypothetical protein
MSEDPRKPLVLHPDDPRRKPLCANDLGQLRADVAAGRVLTPPRDEWDKFCAANPELAVPAPSSGT